MTADEFKSRYMPYHKSLYRLAYGLTANPHDAEDLLQELYMKMWQIRDRISGIANTEAFMATVMRRLYYNHLRSPMSYTKAVTLDVLTDVPSSHDPEILLEERHLYDELVGFIIDLPPKEQKVIRMYLLEELDYREIGSMAGLTQ